MTGVQTCALPIFLGVTSTLSYSRAQEHAADEEAARAVLGVYGHLAGTEALFEVFRRIGDRAARRERVAELFSQVGLSVRTYLQQPRIWVVVPFITLYKLGDELLFAMNSTFLKRELHVSNTQLAWLSGLVGTFTAVAVPDGSTW